MKRNDFVGCFVPEISGVENHPVKKNDRGDCSAEKIMCFIFLEETPLV